MSGTGDLCIYECCFNENILKTVRCGFGSIISFAIMKSVMPMAQTAIDNASII